MKLSIAMIVKNEEENIEKSLDSFKGLEGNIDLEIIVVDTGSNDRTIELARKYTNKVYEHEWNGNFSDMRNISISYCTGEWVLIVDADEVLEDKNTIIDFFKNYEKKYNSVVINFKNTHKNYDVVSSEGRLIRLFRNYEGLRYEGIIHEQPIFKEPAYLSNIVFLHYGYDNKDYKLMNYKFERNVALLKDSLNKLGEDPYLYFQLAQSYSMANKDREALIYIDRAYKILDRNDDSKLFIHHFYVKVLNDLGNYKKSLELIEDAWRLGAENIDFYYFAAKNYVKIGDFYSAIKNYNKYLDIFKGKNKVLGKDSNIVSLSLMKEEEVIKDLCSIYLRLNMYEEIINLYSNIKNKFRDLIKEYYFTSLLNLGKYREAVKIIKYLDKDAYIDIIHSQIIFLNNLEDFKKSFKGINNELDYYLELTLNKNIKGKSEIKYENFYLWKAETLKKELLVNEGSIEKLKGINEVDLKKYLNYITDDYFIIDLLNEYSKRNVFNFNTEFIKFISLIEENLIEESSISGEEFNYLALRLIYNKRILIGNLENFYLNKKDIFWNEIIKVIKLEDELEKVSIMRRLIKKYPEKKRIFEFISNTFISEGYSEEMINQKNSIIDLAENYINSNRLDEADYLLKEIRSIFKTDRRLLNDIAVINYMKNDIESAYKELTLVLSVDENYIDSLFNLAIILERDNRIEEVIYYYEKIISLIKDKQLIEEIKKIINSLKKR